MTNFKRKTSQMRSGDKTNNSSQPVIHAVGFTNTSETMETNVIPESANRTESHGDEQDVTDRSMKGDQMLTFM